MTIVAVLTMKASLLFPLFLILSLGFVSVRASSQKSHYHETLASSVSLLSSQQRRRRQTTRLLSTTKTCFIVSLSSSSSSSTTAHQKKQQATISSRKQQQRQQQIMLGASLMMNSRVDGNRAFIGRINPLYLSMENHNNNEVKNKGKTNHIDATTNKETSGGGIERQQQNEEQQQHLINKLEQKKNKKKNKRNERKIARQRILNRFSNSRKSIKTAVTAIASPKAIAEVMKDATIATTDLAVEKSLRKLYQSTNAQKDVPPSSLLVSSSSPTSIQDSDRGVNYKNNNDDDDDTSDGRGETKKTINAADGNTATDMSSDFYVNEEVDNDNVVVEPQHQPVITTNVDLNDDGDGGVEIQRQSQKQKNARRQQRLLRKRLKRVANNMVTKPLETEQKVRKRVKKLPSSIGSTVKNAAKITTTSASPQAIAEILKDVTIAVIDLAIERSLSRQNNTNAAADAGSTANNETAANITTVGSNRSEQKLRKRLKKLAEITATSAAATVSPKAVFDTLRDATTNVVDIAVDRGMKRLNAKNNDNSSSIDQRQADRLRKRVRTLAYNVVVKPLETATPSVKNNIIDDDVVSTLSTDSVTGTENTTIDDEKSSNNTSVQQQSPTTRIRQRVKQLANNIVAAAPIGTAVTTSAVAATTITSVASPKAIAEIIKDAAITTIDIAVDAKNIDENIDDNIDNANVSRVAVSSNSSSITISGTPDTDDKADTNAATRQVGNYVEFIDSMMIKALETIDNVLSTMEKTIGDARIAVKKAEIETRNKYLNDKEQIVAVGDIDDSSAKLDDDKNQEEVRTTVTDPTVSTDFGGDAVKRPIEVRVDVAPENSRRVFTSIDIVGASVDDVWNVLTDYDNLQNVIPNLNVNTVLELYDSCLACNDTSSEASNNTTAITPNKELELLSKQMKGAKLKQIGGAKVAGINFSAQTTLEVREWPEGIPNFAHYSHNQPNNDMTSLYSDVKLERYKFPNPGHTLSCTAPRIRRDITMQSVLNDNGDFRLYQGVWRMTPMLSSRGDEDTLVGEGGTRLSYAVEISPRSYVPVSLIERRLVTDLCTNLEAIRDYVASEGQSTQSYQQILL